MTTTHTDTDTAETGMVAADLFDVAELVVICDYVADWLGTASPAVHASLTGFAGPDAPAVLLAALSYLRDSLRRAVVPPLASDETAGLVVDVVVESAGTRR